MFKIGDVVVIKSNPEFKMTIEDSNENDSTCIFFDFNKILIRVTVSTNALTLINETS